MVKAILHGACGRMGHMIADIVSRDAGIEIVRCGGDCRCPGGNGSDHADRRGGRVDQIGQFGAGNPVAVGDRAHDRADGQAVEIVVDEDQDAEDEGRQHGAHAGLDVLFRPAPDGRGAAGVIDERHDDAQQYKENEDAGVAGDGGDHAAGLVSVGDQRVQRPHR